MHSPSKPVPPLPSRPGRTRKRGDRIRRRSPLGLFLLLLFWSLILGWGLAQATTPPIGTVDPVDARFQVGQRFYLESCATCHVGLPPAVMPTQTWADLLQDTQHYGTQITPPMQPLLTAVWTYMSTYSRPIIERERVPYRLQDSRYFKALHPKVEFSDRVTVNSCVTCHPAAAQFDFRSLSPEWQDAP